MLTWINAGCDVGLGLPKCQAMHPTSVLGQKQTFAVHQRMSAKRHKQTSAVATPTEKRTTALRSGPSVKLPTEKTELRRFCEALIVAA